MTKLILTDSQFNVFDCLLEELSNHVGASECNLVFCEEKISLMTERKICERFTGSFNTDVYSFGNYMRKRIKPDKLLSKEGSSMAVKRVLSKIPLKRFSASKTGLAPSLYELIAQLKSAKVGVEDLKNATVGAKGLLKDKLTDIAEVYSAYEDFLAENGYDDQNSSLSYLPEIIQNDLSVKECNVYIIGFTGFTAQIRSAIKTLLLTAKSVTAILVSGENKFAYVNETADDFTDICASVNVKPIIEKRLTRYSEEAKTISRGLFNPIAKNNKITTEKIVFSTFGDIYKEAEAVAETIYSLVKDGKCRFKDISVCVPDTEEYKDALSSAMQILSVPYFLDTVTVPVNHPLISLILSYIEVFKQNFEKKAVKNFYKNPLISDDKDLNDEFENYLLRYNVNYSAIKKPFTFKEEGQDVSRLEEFRLYICSLLEKFDVREIIKRINAEEKLLLHTEKLKNCGQNLAGDLNSQILSAVDGVLSEMEEILGQTQISFSEYKSVFLSGIASLELSVIPQYNDAVFIGAFKEVGLVKNEYLFCMGLTSAVPQAKEDVALLSDIDINALSELKVLVEPKIKVINHRTRQDITLCLSAFKERLYLSYPIVDSVGKQNVKSQIISYMQNAFTLKPFAKESLYLTEKQGYNSFARGCSEFCEGINDDFTLPATFYHTVDKDITEKILSNANKQVKIRLNKNARAVFGNVSSPTAIEEYYKCPYRFFLKKGLKLNERKESKTDSLSIGIIMHEALRCFFSEIDKINDINIDRKIDEILEKVLNKSDFAPLKDDSETANSLFRVADECKKYCKKVYNNYKQTDFKKVSTEVGFGDVKGAVYPAIILNDGNVKLSGIIDRIDEYNDYCRIIDYKTGKTSVDISEKSLFTGNKLQLYLYAKAVNDKKLAGVYYLFVSDEYSSQDAKEKTVATGKTLDDIELVKAQDNGIGTDNVGEFTGVKIKNGELKNTTQSKTFDALTDYALTISNNAVKQMTDGVIVASPYEDTCSNCVFKAMCQQDAPEIRKVGSVSEETIEKAIYGEEECRS